MLRETMLGVLDHDAPILRENSPPRQAMSQAHDHTDLTRRSRRTRELRDETVRRDLPARDAAHDGEDALGEGAARRHERASARLLMDVDVRFP